MGEKITKMDRQPIISAKDVEITFSLRGKKLNAIRKCSLDLYDGETLAIVGESGSGKSVFTKTFVGMLDVNGKITGGSIMYEGRDMTKFTEKDWLGVRGKKIAMVMQDPMTSLNPLKKIGKQIQESIEHHQGLKGAEAKKAAIEMLAKVGIPDPERRYEQYPHEFSGGMRQRVVIAIAAACRPQILICDEPTTALDVTIQAQILQLIRDLQKELGMSVIYITHDLGVVANVADRVAVMYAGQIVEYGTVEEIFYDAWHPYTWALLQALPQLGTKGEALPTIDGTPPNLFNEIKGDAFAPRNKHALAIDFVAEPPFFQVSGSGKTTIGRAICRINPTSGGDIFFKGQKINGKISKELDREVIRKVQMIFQDPMASLNERAKVEYIVAEGLLNHHLYKDQDDLHEKVMNALHEVGLLPEFASRFPHEFSGGQRQRIGIARALVMEPEFIVADEPISALDVSIRAQVLNLLNSMKKSRGLTYLFIAHDLSVVRFISDRIAVISKGRIVELAEAEELFLHPLHPYTKALLSAVPIPDPGLEKKKKLLVYDPSIHDYSVDKPVWEEIANGHFVYGNQKELEGYRKEYQSQL